MGRDRRTLFDPAAFKWFYPGMRVKRWLLLSLFGVFLIAISLSLLTSVHLLTWLEDSLVRFSNIVPGDQRSTRWLNAAILMIAGAGVFAVGLRNMVRSIVATILPVGTAKLADRVYLKRQLERGPKIVVIGGGTGLATLLRGLKTHTQNLTAIVTVADDGGSSGRIRSEMGILPPGDIRMCLAALADTEPLMERLFQYRFGPGHNGLAGHTFGNLFIATMTEITGDFEVAVKESSKVLAIRGQVVPSTLSDVVLQAEMTDGTRVDGESYIAKAGKRVHRISLRPENAEPLPEAIAAIESADAVIVGPGSLYTSILPNLLVRGITDALRRTKAIRVYVCNVMTQPGETDGYTASDHLQAIYDHVGEGVVDAIIVNTEPIAKSRVAKYREQGQLPVVIDPDRLREMNVVPVAAPLISQEDLVRHDSDRLAEAIINLLGRGAGPRNSVWRDFYLASVRR